MWTNVIACPESLVRVAREDGTRFVISYAQWVLPQNKREGLQKPSACHRADWGAAGRRLRCDLIPDTTVPLLIGSQGEARTRERLLASIPAVRTALSSSSSGTAAPICCSRVSRTAGAGTLTPSASWPLGEAKALYKRLGFGKTSRLVLEMEAFGGTGKHIKIAMG
ncbi:hypothetical protein AB5N19_01461 [Seiridium cardinale]